MDSKFTWTVANLAGSGLYLSDLHAGRDARADHELRAMLHWLTAVDRGYRWVCWGGDIFDFLAAGNTAALGRTAWVVQAMRDLASRGVRQYLIEGNHDFHLGFLTQHVPDLVVAPDGVCDASASLALVHGDWHTAGGLYGPMRRVFRSAWLHTALSIGPHHLIDTVAQAWSRGSHEVRGGPPESAYLSHVARCFRQAMEDLPQYRTWLSGHIHWPAQITHAQQRCYINGEWAVHRTAIHLPGDGSVRYVYWQGEAMHAYTGALGDM